MTVATDPIVRFVDTFARAAAQAPFDHTAASLATATPGGEPSVRVVLVRQFDDRGFVFFTNYESRKGEDLAANPAGSLCFYWPWIDEMVRIEGPLTKVSPEESDAYFATRPRGSQIGAWASNQSRPLSDRSELERRYFDIERQYEGQNVPRPPHWGGYRLKPRRVEFWKAGEYRLHDRWLYTATPDGWDIEMLFP
jgi:pyridoxamine 5'-phosphate oxidase